MTNFWENLILIIFCIDFQATLIRADDGQPIEANLITADGIRPHTELFRVGTTVYTIEERRPDNQRMN